MRVQLLLLSLLMLVDWTEGKCKTGKLTAAEQVILDKHNALRRLHKDTPDLCYGVSGSDVTFSSDTWAKFMASKKAMSHSDSAQYGGSKNKYGENLAYAGTSGTRVGKQKSYEASTQAWYDEIKDWNFAKSAKKGKGVTGHFTQVVWKDSEQLNCAYAEFTNSYNSYYVVCQYYPAGNWMSEYAAQVQPLGDSNETEDNKDDKNKNNGSAKDSVSDETKDTDETENESENESENETENEAESGNDHMSDEGYRRPNASIRAHSQSLFQCSLVVMVLFSVLNTVRAFL